MVDRAVVAAIPSEGFVTEGRGAASGYFAGAVWKNIPGLIDYAESGGAAPTRDVVPLTGGVGKRVGRARVPSITLNAFQVPHHPAWDALRTAKLEETVIEFRMRSVEQVLYLPASTKTAAIADTGVVTFAGVGDEPTIEGNAIGPGDTLHAGGENYTIERVGIDADGNSVAAGMPGYVTVVPPSAPVSAEDAIKISIPEVQRGPFRARVIDTDQWSLQAEGELQAALMLQPFGQLPKAVMSVAPIAGE